MKKIYLILDGFYSSSVKVKYFPEEQPIVGGKKHQCQINGKGEVAS